VIPVQDYRSSHLEKGPDYDRLFEEGGYPHFMWQFERAILGEVIHRRFDGKPFRHLDVACGTGRILEHVEPMSKCSLGIDISASMLRTARTRVKNATVVRGDFAAPSPPFSRRFDLITCFRFFLNAEPWLRAGVARNARNLLADGGLFVFNNHRNSRSLTYRMLRDAGHTYAELACMSHEEASEMIDDAGLKIVHIYHVGIVPGTDHRMYVPYRLGTRLESIAAKISVLKHLSNDLVYVCARG
jgi:predicted TPR repeat methyltransferase